MEGSSLAQIVVPALAAGSRPVFRGGIIAHRFVAVDGVGTIKVGMTGSGIVAEHAHGGWMLGGIVCLVGVGSGKCLLGFCREGDISIVVGMLNRHVVALASGEDCEENDKWCYYV